MTKIKLLSLACLTVLLAGCTSLDYHSEPAEPLVYPGVRADYECIVHLPGKDPFWPFYTTYSVIDMPFSFAVDTLYFPFDLFAVARFREYQESLRRFPPDPDPLAGWKQVADSQPDSAIVADYKGYIDQLPPEQRKALIVNDRMVKFFEDGRGSHAMEIRLLLRQTLWKHVLVYDESNKRVKVLKYANGHSVQ